MELSNRDVNQIASLILLSPETNKILRISSNLDIKDGMSTFTVENEHEKWGVSIQMTELEK